jgi:hypothetical protein
VNLGAEPKKVAMLVGILVFGAGAVYYANSDDSASSSYTPPPAPVAVSAPAPGVRTPGPRPKAQVDRRQISNRASATAVNYRMGTQNPEDRPDPATVDPSIKMDLLAKVQSVELGAPGRNLFIFGSAPAPPPPVGLPKAPTISTKTPVGPEPPPQPPVKFVPPVPSAPPMTFKYYGFKISRTDGHKAAFLLDGEDILIGGENDIFKKHYRIVRINPASIVIEDTDFKTTQTLQLQENNAG